MNFIVKADKSTKKKTEKCMKKQILVEPILIFAVIQKKKEL